MRATAPRAPDWRVVGNISDVCPYTRCGRRTGGKGNIGSTYTNGGFLTFAFHPLRPNHLEQHQLHIVVGASHGFYLRWIRMEGGYPEGR